ncbi:MAG: hypothetical protein HFG80_03395 [Eubacterium sp.]|nr:hypothetical protein [Eubacterium sp.]
MYKLAKSKMGHDRNKVYVIYREEEDFVYLTDGDLKKTDRPKKKNKKHIQPILKLSREITDILENTAINEDERIRKALKEYERSVKNDKIKGNV